MVFFTRMHTFLGANQLDGLFRLVQRSRPLSGVALAGSLSLVSKYTLLFTLLPSTAMYLKLAEQLLCTEKEIFCTFLRSCSQQVVEPGRDEQAAFEQLKVKQSSVSELPTDTGACGIILQGRSGCLFAQLW